jgi:hypothetical protein
MRAFDFFLLISTVSLLLLLQSCAVPVNTSSRSASGEELYQQKCSFCHRPFPPESRGLEEWVDVLDEMGPKAGLTDAEVELILKFLSERSGG